MPRGLNNWKFRDVEKFLAKHGFSLNYVNGSHHYFTGIVDKKFRQVTVQKHSGESLKPRTMKSIVDQSGISKEKWLDKK